MSALYTHLQWLPPAPEDFSARLKALESSDGLLGGRIQELASHSLDLNQLTRLSRAVQRLREAGRSLHPLVPFRLGILGNSTTDMMVPALVASAIRHGVDLEVISSPYGQAAQEAFNPHSTLNSSKPDAVLLALDYRALPMKVSLADAASAEASVQDGLGCLQALRDGVQNGSQAVCIFQTMAPPPETLLGSLDRSLPGTLRNLIDEVNRRIAADALKGGNVLLDVAALAETVGLANWHSPSQWNIARFAFADEFIPLYADHVGRILGSIRGKSRKVLVLDLDNTIWGGVIGDAGVEGIQLAQGDAVGEAHLTLQRMALELRERGILLAISSRNTDEVAREPFQKHPEMLLKLNHITVFQANWDDKATNIQAIAGHLDLGLDSIVLLDDNPVERGLVRQLLPQVAVPELPDDPALFARTLAAAGYFEAIAFAGEDLKRAGFYEENARRAELNAQVGGVDAYLASLDMNITFQPFDATGRTRIVQLINKSNQYNLTTRRYTEPEIAAAEADQEVFTLQVRLSDRFGDNGMISVVICRPDTPNVWQIDTWLMSCRVIGRKVEHMVLGEIIKHARARGVATIKGFYSPTGRNKLVIDHYVKLGFEKMGENTAGTTYWGLKI